MAKGSINIDDSGTPGSSAKSEFLSESRKSWTAVIIPDSVADDVSQVMAIFLEGVKSDFGAQELHFTDIYSGRGPWENVPIEKRIEIFALMSKLMGAYSLPVVHQTVSNQIFDDHPQLRSIGKKRSQSFWDPNNLAHLGFLFLCSNVAKYLRELHSVTPDDFRIPMQASVDEGLAKCGSYISLPNWGDVFAGQTVRSVSSSKDVGVQIADYAAFSISRSQWILAQQDAGTPVRRGDLEFLKNASTLNIMNLPIALFNVEEISRDSYEAMLSHDRVQKGLVGKPRIK